MSSFEIHGPVGSSDAAKLYIETVLISNNKTIVCHDPHKIASNGFWTKEDPLHFSTPLLLLQLSLVSITSMLIDFILRPLGQCTMISQIFGGIVFGPTMLGHVAVVGATLFPPRGYIIFETFATFGIAFFVFTIGSKMDPITMIRPGWKPMVIGLSATVTTLAFAVVLGLFMRRFVSSDSDLFKALPLIAASQCILSFQNVSSVLGELKMLQSDLGRFALSASIFCDLIGIGLMATGTTILQTSTAMSTALAVVEISVFVLFLLFAVFIVRPIILRSTRKIPEGKQPSENQIMAIFICLLVATFCSELVGQHFVFGPLILGLIMPEGSTLASAVTAKLEIPIGKLLYPTFLTASGLKTNAFAIHLQSFLAVGTVVLLSCIVKLLAVMLPAFFMDFNVRESFIIGLMMNTKGITELILFNILLDVQAIQSESFALCVLSVISVTAIVTPLIKLLYNPSQRNIPVRRRTIQHCKRDAELRILVCLHNQEEVPEVLNLLEASRATEESPIIVIAVLLVELVGRTNPMLIAHQPHRILQPSSSRSGRIINALRQYEFCNESCVSMQSFSSVAEYETMHEDICRVALDHNANIVILPFQKRWEIDGSIGAVNRGIQATNVKVAEHAPCSVAVFVDRGILRGPGSIFNFQSTYRVGLIFIGGGDDAEALSYAARMVRHQNVRLTICRFLLLGSDTMRERKMDNGLIDEVRQANIGNQRFEYQEEMVLDGVGLAASVKGLGSMFELILVGRNHQDCPLLVGLNAWIELPELGVIGDMLAAADSEQTASVLVVQQQRLKGKFTTRMAKPPVVVNQQDVIS